MNSLLITQDEELKGWFKDAAENLDKPINKELQEFLEQEGFPLPKNYSDLPIGDFCSIPVGAKLTDEEIASLMSYNLLLALQKGMHGLTESVHADIGLLYSKCIIREMTFAMTLKDLMQTRGWLQAPPPYFPQNK